MNTFSKVLILGIGNILLSDDGFGISAAQDLSKKNLPADVFVLDIGTAAVSYLYEISHCNNLIIIHAICAGDTPGTIYQMTATDISYPPAWLSESHDLSIISVVHQARMLTGLPAKVLIYGVEPYTLEICCYLSPMIAKALPTVTKLIEQVTADLISNGE